MATEKPVTKFASLCKYKQAVPPGIEFVDADTVRKSGTVFQLQHEVEAMRYVQSNTSLPVPTVLETHLNGERGADGWILMTRLPGQQLDRCWSAMHAASRAETIRQLKLCLDELHRIRPPAPAWIGSCSRGPAYDHRFDYQTTYGPFSSVGEFHDFLVAPVRRSPQPGWVDRFRPLLPDHHEIVFCHADFWGGNILVEPSSGVVTGILDWEMAGFWPAWWEYRKATRTRQEKWWMDIVGGIMEQYPIEAWVDGDLELFF
jgi:aminoglycoside phosphotransferase (APT) family kinase protein